MARLAARKATLGCLTLTHQAQLLISVHLNFPNPLGQVRYPRS